METLLPTEQALDRFAADFLEIVSRYPRQGRAVVVGLSGDLGAGKTAFTKAFGRAAGIRETITSPTFVIEKTYPMPQGAPFSRLLHIDAYRLGSPDELHLLGWEEIVGDEGNLIFVEWPERIAGILPLRHILISFSPEGEGRVARLSYEEGR